MPDKPPRRRGRPRREAGEQTLPTLAFRPSPDTRKLVDDGAGESGLSLSAEIDRRLRQAYWDRQRHHSERDRVFGGDHNFTLAFLLSRVATGVEHSCGASWQEDGLVWREVATAMVALLQLMRGLDGGTVELPVGIDGRPNARWDVANFSRAHGPTDTPSREPHWVYVLRLVDLILRRPVDLHWPLVDRIKTSHADYRDDFMPSADQLKRLYGLVGSTTVAA